MITNLLIEMLLSLFSGSKLFCGGTKLSSCGLSMRDILDAASRFAAERESVVESSTSSDSSLGESSSGSLSSETMFLTVRLMDSDRLLMDRMLFRL